MRQLERRDNTPLPHVDSIRIKATAKGYEQLAARKLERNGGAA